MIPVRLKMHNFMPYRGEMPSFDFTGINIACICGDNGAGKSALIDAITWALWGKTRAKSDDELVSLGETTAEVVFDFTVGGQLYRIIRKHALPKKASLSGQSSLDLLIKSNGDYKAVSGDTKGQTQQKIIDTLHMDYDTFVSSAFLKQGHADQFTEQPPSKRKEVLASILGLDIYDTLEQRARERARQKQAARELLEVSISEMGSELGQKSQVQEELIEAQQKLAATGEQAEKQQVQVTTLREQKLSLDGKRQRLTELENSIAKANGDRQRWQENLSRIQARVEESQQLIYQREAILQGFDKFSKAQRLNDELGRKLMQLRRLEDRRSQHDIAIDKALGKLSSRHDITSHEIQGLEEKLAMLEKLKGEAIPLVKSRQELMQRESELKTKTEATQSLRLELARLNTERERLLAEIKSIDEKVNLLAEGDASCPLCETELGSEGIEVVRKKYATEKKEKTEVVSENESQRAAKGQELKSLDTEIGQMETVLNRDKEILLKKETTIKQASAEAESLYAKLGEARENLSAIEEKMAAKDFATAEQEALAGIQNEIARLEYDHQEHEQATSDVEANRKFEDLKRRLDEAERALQQEKETAARTEEAIKDFEQRLEDYDKKKTGLAAELESLPSVLAELKQAEAALTELLTQQHQAQQQVGSLNERLKRCQELEKKKAEKEKALKQAAEEETIYKELTTAFGKKGIQQIIIETAIPEIENEANRLLGKMTDNRLSVTLETQRLSKKGETLETLDIKIGDELGTRSYEMFSGGEAFRIDFALRIALSRLLARRAGAPLPTLIIDEGFGTQDIAGLERLKEAISSIQDDFEKILVITHIEDLKESFPVRIEVTKTATGSKIGLS